MSVKDSLTRGLAVFGVATTLAGAGHPATAGSTRDLTKQYAAYSAKVRVPETGREIRRALSASTAALSAGKGDSSLVTKKAVRRLK